jgi:hypothetical protein
MQQWLKGSRPERAATTVAREGLRQTIGLEVKITAGSSVRIPGMNVKGVTVVHAKKRDYPTLEYQR